MKPLRTIAIAATDTLTETLAKTAAAFSDVILNIEPDVEKAIEGMNAGNYDLLIIDKRLNRQEQNRLDKLSEILFPHAAVVIMSLQDEDFIRFKLSGLLSKWKDVQQETTRKFFDDPGFSS